MGDNNWDLYAVVRGCSSGTTAVSDPFSSFLPPSVLDGEKGDLFSFPYLTASAESASDYELEELCKPFNINPQEQQLPAQQQFQPLLAPKPSYPSSTPAAASLFPAIFAIPHQLIQQSPRQLHRPLSRTSRSKRRKSQQKKVVCQIPADGVSSDVWAWRKYGQKPIKGSPYPRGYYRCSSSKGCQARKQVERSREDPGMLLITFTAEHNHPIPTHRNSLSRSTRQNLPPPPNSSTQPLSALSLSASGGGGDHDRLISSRKSSSSPLSSPTAAAGLSPTTPLTDSMEDELLRKRRRRRVKTEEQEKEEEEQLLAVSDMEMMDEHDMMFLDMEVIGDPTATGSTKSPTTVSVDSGFFEDEGNLEDHFFRSSPWLSNSNAAAAAGGS